MLQAICCATVSETSERYKRALRLKRAYWSSWYDLASRKEASNCHWLQHYNSSTSTSRHQLNYVHEVVNLPAWLVFAWKLAYKIYENPFKFVKIIVEKISGTLFIWTRCISET